MLHVPVTTRSASSRVMDLPAMPGATAMVASSMSVRLCRSACPVPTATSTATRSRPRELHPLRQNAASSTRAPASALQPRSDVTNRCMSSWVMSDSTTWRLSAVSGQKRLLSGMSGATPLMRWPATLLAMAFLSKSERREMLKGASPAWLPMFAACPTEKAGRMWPPRGQSRGKRCIAAGHLASMLTLQGNILVESASRNSKGNPMPKPNAFLDCFCTLTRLPVR